MSDTANASVAAEAPQVDREMLLKTAFDQIHTGVYAPAFMQKLAAHNIVPESDEQAQQLLDLGWQLREIYEQQKTAAASPQSQLIKLASSNLGLHDHQQQNIRGNVAASLMQADQRIAAAADILTALTS